MPNKLKRTKRSLRNSLCGHEEQRQRVEPMPLVLVGATSANSVLACPSKEEAYLTECDRSTNDEVKVATTLVSSSDGRPPPHSEDVTGVRQNLACLTSSSLHSCLMDIQASSPTFPVQTVFATLQRKARERLEDYGRTDEKRKQELESCEKASKRLRSKNVTAVGSCVAMETTEPRVSRLSRTRKLKQQVVAEHKPSHAEMNQPRDVNQNDTGCDNVLWTDKYSPQCAGQLIGNSLQVNKLHSWLKKWKQRADCDERRPAEQIKPNIKSGGTVSTEDSWDCGDFQGEAGSEQPTPCNAMLITGPSGSGKTASVYACARELGFKVFEVNSSSQRCGRQILCQLKEVTQSHLVETAGKDLLKPAYFNNSSKGSSSQRETLAGKLSAPKKVRQKCGRLRRARKESPAAVSLKNFFKMKAKADQLCSLSPSETLEDSPSGSHQTVQQIKKGAMSLILFEEVDVQFEDDVGFLAAIKMFMATTKRPVVLTSNDPTFRKRFSSSLEEVVFKTPSAMHVCSYLQLVCLAEGVKMELDEVQSLHMLTRGDVRRCLLQLQFWVNSVKGLPEEHPCCTNVEGERWIYRSAGCTASMLGLHPVRHLLNPLKGSSWTEAHMNKLTESWRRNVPLLYSNLELLVAIRAPLGTAVPTATDAKPPRFRKRMVTGSSLTQKAQKISSYFRATAHQRSGQTAPKAEFQTLNSLAEFFDLMSYLDNTVAAAAPRTREFVWTGADVKDGSLDEMSENEEGWSRNQESLLEIRSTVEGLGCRTEAGTCRREQGDVSWSFTSRPLCDPVVSQRRYRLSRAVLNSRFFSLQGNRQAVCVDYMPALRSISRSSRQQGDEPVRCLNYLYNLHLGLSKSTLHLMAENFSSKSLANLSKLPH
ncbi:ATPase family AAA domain-containing protein 5-like isoform X2 [Entelurus aequoreus]|uniref:ATPase family AAA domain-containing protein 5-like isoform X2 n=1 Tax=Entelurus aequoreus TaxID=161455 RepID=UPI002B1D0047|nr:ATPase family AAA domain-containing protein 5-like isoform X2 [Entelurus aequoreus]